MSSRNRAPSFASSSSSPLANNNGPPTTTTPGSASTTGNNLLNPLVRKMSKSVSNPVSEDQDSLPSMAPNVNLVSVDPSLTVIGAVKLGSRGYIDTMHKKRKAIVEQCVRGKGSIGQRFQVFRAPSGKWNINEPIDEGGNSVLHIASLYNDIALVVYIIQRGGDALQPNEAGISPIDIAKHLKHTAIERALVSSIYLQPNCLASPIKPAESHDIPILFELAIPTDPHLSMDMGSSEQNCYTGSNLVYVMTDTEAQNAADPINAMSSKPVCWSPLMKAAYRGQVKIATWLIVENKAKVNQEDPKGYTALHWAALNGHAEIVQLLCNNGANVNARSVKTFLYPLHCACYHGYPAVVKILLDSGADPNTSNSPITPLMVASWRGLPAVVAILLAKGAKLDPTSASAKTRGWWKKSLDFLQHGDPEKITTQGKYQDDYIEIRCLLDLVSNWENNTKNEVSSLDRLAGLVKTESDLLGQFPASMVDRNYNFVLQRRFANCIKSVKKADLGRLMSWREAIKVSEMGDFESEMSQMITKLPVRGTSLDILVLNIVASLGEMINSWIRSEKHKLASYSAVISENMNQLVKMAEYVLERMDQSLDTSPTAITSYEKVIWCHGPIRSSLQEMTMNLKNNMHREFVVKTKIALGVWPPPSAFHELIKFSVSLVADVKKLCLLLNFFGVYEEGYIQIHTLNDASPVSANAATEDRLKLDYSTYKKNEELQKIHELQIKDRTNQSDDDSVGKKSNSEIEEKLYVQIELIVSQVVKSIQSLKLAKDQERKELYVPSASDVVAKMEMLVDEIRKNDVFYNVENMVIPANAGISTAAGGMSIDANGQQESSSGSSNSIKNILKRGGEEILKKAEEIVHHARLASGVWPPATAVPNMIQAIIACLTFLKAYVNGTKGLMQWIWKNMDEERLKQLQWKRECMQTELARSLFKVLEKGTSEIEDSTPVDEDSEILLDDSVDGLVIEKINGIEVIKGGKLSQLVERLAHHTYFDPEFQTAFLLTHNSFTTSANLLDLILRRYDIFPPFGLSERQFSRYISKKIVPIKLRIANIIKQWIDRHFDDFAYNDALIGTLRVFLEKRLVEDFDNLSLRLIKILDEKLEGLIKNYNIISTDRSMPKPILPKQFVNPEMGHHGLLEHLKAYHRNVFELDPLEVARQMTLIDSNLFRKILAKECLNQAWASKDKLNKAPNIARLVAQTNALTRWVATSLLEVDFVKARIILIRWFCQLLQHLRELNNFNGMTTIVAGLSMGSVSRLSETWGAFKDKNGKLYEFMKECQSLVSPKGQYAEYRKTLKQCNFPALPFIGVYLTDLTFIEDGNPDFLAGAGSFINFEKRRKVSVIIREIQGYQITPFSLQPVPPLLEYLESHSKLDLRVIHEDKELYALSLKHEKRQEDQ